ncbi:hypothetical protein D5086_023953 [Populus alba]|uniref:Uncharacterized protein n=1 Tax=Populus alba TaxID=43335 RepID=A0ACC4B4Q8_POPAL
MIAICQLGGEFVTDKDGTLSYRGGDAHAIDIDDQIKFNDFKVEVAEMFNCSVNTMSLKYFLPGNKKTLITISNDKDLKRMIKFHGDSVTADVYVILEDNFLPGVSNLPASRSSRTTLSEAVPPIDAPLAILEDITQPDNSLVAPLDLDVVDDTNNVDIHIEDQQIDPLEISPILPLLASNDEKHAKGAQQWQNTITGDLKGQFSHEVKRLMIEDLNAAAYACRPEIFQRRADSNQWLTRLTPSAEEKLEKESLKVHSLQVLLSAGSIFEVRGESVEVVDIDRWDCSCKDWQLTGLPCCHALAVIGCIGRSPYDYCSRYFTTESYRLTYSESVHPVPNVDMPLEKDSSQVAVTVTPPPTRRPPGRPTTKKYGQQDVVKRQLQCSRCKGLGHNKSTCKVVEC